MKIAIAQLNYHIGNFAANAEKIISAIQAAKQDGAEIVVFSELSVCGYPPLDMLEQKDFIDACMQTAQAIALHCHGIAAVIGCPTINPDDSGKKLYNSALVLQNGVVSDIYHKGLLPTYDIFDEYRYFEPAARFHTVQIQGRTVALTICEDLWNEQLVENSFGKSRIYRVNPMEQLAKENPELIINIAASPFSYKQEKIRTAVLCENAKRYALPLVYANQVGANTEIIFDGNSKILHPDGSLLALLPAFDECVQTFDLNSNAAVVVADQDKIEKIHRALIVGIKDYFRKSGFKTATLGLSGGIDSAVTAALAAEALGKENVHGLLLPSRFSSDHSISDAVALAENLGIAYSTVPIAPAVDSFDQCMAPLFAGTKFGLAEENIQARIRGSLLMAFSNKFGHILLNTSNKSEAAVGYGTLYGDMNGGISVLGDVYKTEVFELARYINRDAELIPVNSIVKPPSAELRPDQKDSDSLPEYDILDGILYLYIEEKLQFNDIVARGFDHATVAKTISMVNRNEYKRFQTAPILRVSTKAFGLGRRIPLVAEHLRFG